MKIITLLLLAVMLGQIAHAELVQAPPVEVNQETLGGHVILIKMKEYLVVSGRETAQLTQELGAAKKDNFLLDITMEKSLEHLFGAYDVRTDSTSLAILKRYADIQIRLAAPKKTLN